MFVRVVLRYVRTKLMEVCERDLSFGTFSSLMVHCLYNRLDTNYRCMSAYRAGYLL